MKADTHQRRFRRRMVMAIRAALVAVLFAVPASSLAATAHHQERMPQAMKIRLAKAHKVARIRCHRVARTAQMKRLCGRINPPKPRTVKRTASVAAGYRQYGFVCRFDGDWFARPFTSVDDFRADQRDFLLWMQFPPGLDLLPGGTIIMTVFASVYCDVYGRIAWPTASTQNPPPVQPDAPTFVDSCGISGDRYRIPDAVPVPLFTLFGPDETTVNLTDPDVGMMYLVNGQVTAPGTYAVPTTGSRTITIDAVPTTSRYTVRTPRRWVLTFDDTPCPVPVSPVRPTQTGVCGPNNDTITRVAEIEGLTYRYGSWSDNTRTVTATADDGYVIPGESDGVMSWTFTDANTPCPIPVATRAPTVREVCGPLNDLITVPSITGVKYTVADWQDDGTLTVTAAATAGYVISAGSPVAWKVIDGARECPIVKPPSPPTKLTIRMVGKRVRPADKVVVYGLFIRNVGTTTAQNVVIRDPIPTGLSVTRRPVEGIIRRRSVIWAIGDLQPGSWIFLNVRMRSVHNRTVRRCNLARAAAGNAAPVRARRCTRFVRVEGARFGGVTG